MSITTDIIDEMKKGKANEVVALVKKGIADGMEAFDILQEGLLSGMDIIGEEFRNGDIFVPEVLVAAKAMAAGMQELKPYLGEGDVSTSGVVVIGTVKGDLHDIGKNLVKMLMEAKGLNVIDLGADVEVEEFIDAAIKNNANIICCSALLTTTMTQMQNIVNAVNASELKGKVKVMVGGAPISESFADSIGADKYTPDAASAAEAALAFCA